MDQSIVQQVRDQVNRGIEAVRSNHADEADVLFFNALDNLSNVKNDRVRRDEFAALSGVFEKCGFPELALRAAEDAVELDQKLGLKKLLPQDIIAIGNAHVLMDNVVKAEEKFQEALAMLQKAEDWANAASANTNMANIIANRGEHKKAISMLEKSLEYLEKEPFENTELNTRFALMQLMEFTQGDVDQAIDNARKLCSRFFGNMPNSQRQVVADFVSKSINRYLEANTDIDARVWKPENFPELY